MAMAFPSPHTLTHLGLSLFALCCALSTVPGLSQELTLQLVREMLVRQEDTIIFALIERAKYPSNSVAYRQLFDATAGGGGGGGGVGSLVEAVARGTEALQAKAGRYQNPEEVPFFGHDLPLPSVPLHNFSHILHPAAAGVNVSSTIWDIYFHKVLPLIVAKGDDGNYASAAASDLICLQALSWRIHYGRFVAEVKFRDAPNDYTPAILEKDRGKVTKLLTSERVEAAVVQRVEKKAMAFGKGATIDNVNSRSTGYKVDPRVASRLYSEWVIPLTKLVEVEYLLRRLD